MSIIRALWSPRSAIAIQSQTRARSVSFTQGAVTARISFSVISGRSAAKYWAIAPPCDTPITAALSIPSVRRAAAWSSAMPRIVKPRGSGSRRLNIQTVYRLKNIL